ncbi:MAG: hypothetical protein IJ690_04185 [Clostridia bacterium]|nr:hypothetical protein [Clostridia bacterium]
MHNIKDKFLAKIEEKGSKKTIENLVVFVIILIATVIFINYIWNGDKKKSNQQNKSVSLAETTNKTVTNNTSEDNNLEKQLENILRNLNGVEDVQVLITYSETNKIIPMYNEDNQQSTTKEEDNQGGTRTINENSSKKEVVYEENNGQRNVLTSSVVTPEIKGAVIVAKGASNANVKNNIIQAVEAATGLPTHKIQVLEMK